MTRNLRFPNNVSKIITVGGTYNLVVLRWAELTIDGDMALNLRIEHMEKARGFGLIAIINHLSKQINMLTRNNI